MSRLLVAAFYAFTPLDDTRREALLETLPVLARDGAVLGSVLVANEGVNGTISGPEPGVHAVLAHLRTSLDLGDDHYARLEVKRSWADQPVFRRFKARHKKEIVTIGISRVDPSASVGTYVDPQDWNALVDDPDTLVIDTRNSYETAIGTFDGAIDPGTESFRDFPQAGLSRPCGRCLSSRAASDRHVLHRRHPLREGQQLPAAGGLRGGAPPARRHSQVPRAGAGKREPLAGRMLCLRSTGGVEPPTGTR